MDKPIEVTGGGIKCDNPKCDYSDESVKMEDYDQWLNKPCPKCGENLLNEEDYFMVKTLLALVSSDLVKNLDIPADPDDPGATMRLDIHNKTLDIDINTEE